MKRTAQNTCEGYRAGRHQAVRNACPGTSQTAGTALPPDGTGSGCQRGASLTAFVGVDLNTVTVPKILCQHHHKPGEELYVVPAPEYKASLGSYMTGWKRATQHI